MSADGTWGRLVGTLGDQVGADSRLRIGDDEREAAVRHLGEHYATGRLTADEHEERTELAWSAKTRADLTPLFRDLPVTSDGAQFLAPPDSARASRPSPRRGAIPTPIVVLLAVIAATLLVSALPILLIIAVAWWVISGHARSRWGHRHDGGRHGYRNGPSWARRTARRGAR